MIPIDLWTAEGRAEMQAHLTLIAEIGAAEAKLRALEAGLPEWLRRERTADMGIPVSDFAPAEPAVYEPNGLPSAPPVTAEDPEAAPLAPMLDTPEAWDAAPAPERPAEAMPVEAQAPSAEDPTDPERWIDDAMKAEIWRMDQDGFTAADIAAEMSLAPKRVQNLLYRIKAGKHPVPGEAPASTAIATTSTGVALVVSEREIARDPEMVQQWRDELAEGEREKFVARSEYPEMHP